MMNSQNAVEALSSPGGLEFDHRDGFARRRRHEADRIRLLCRAHNQHAADQMYGRTFMQRARTRGVPQPSLPGIRSDLTELDYCSRARNGAIAATNSAGC